jgi:DNA repair exonuclease SbcCD ATPase subunit
LQDKVPHYNFPRLHRVQLHSFSLFRLRPDASLDFKPGVSCLAGANGIGKSTFLATLNYGLTGAVPHPRRRLLSIQSYLKEATDYSSTFFNGRIDEKDRDAAAISIDFSLAAKKYSINRGLFDPSDIRKLTIGDDEAVFEGAPLTPIQREAAYKDHVARDAGLSSFEQFLFLQHFVFTFDESRHLLFWDEAATAQALFLCFGGDPQDAQRADILNREAEKAGSRGRNAQFQVNNTRKRIEILSAPLNPEPKKIENLEELDAAYQSLVVMLETSARASEELQSKFSQATVTLSERSAKVASLRSRYTEVFNRFLVGGASFKSHPLIIRAARELHCEICNTTDASVAVHVNRKLNNNVCPFCETLIVPIPTGNPALSDELASIDRLLADARNELEEATLLEARLSAEARSAQAEVIKAREAVALLESNNQDLAELLQGRQAARRGPLAETLEGLERARIEFTAARDTAYSERDELRDELKKLQRDLEVRYANAEQSFVPRFRELTNLFLGIDLDVSFVASPPTGVKLTVEMRGDVRREEDQMSESQRFFVDIALRMALAQQMSNAHGPSTLFIDTPEGSLDIAYEDRAGEMFARFVQSGHDMLITANINSSKLLSTLGERCGTKSMTLHQMTGWTELSDVQQSATQLFQRAYKEISDSLQRGPT